MRKKYIIALDQGTTSSRAVIFDTGTMEVKYIKSKPHKQIYPQPGWVEHDPEEILAAQVEVMREAVRDSGISPCEVACIGITNQRETVVVWDKSTGKPVYNAIVWQCRRTAGLCDRLKNDGLQEVIKEKTGLVIDAYFSGTKIQWILDNVPGASEMARKGELLAGTIDSWLVWNLTGGKLHVTDYSNASRTMLYNIKNLDWDEDLLHKMDIPRSIMPRVVPSSGIIGETCEDILESRVPISGIAGDQQAALFGQACFDEGTAKNTYGTGCFILMNTGKRPVESRHGLLSTIAWAIGSEVEYALEGSVFNAGSVIQWLRDEVGLIKTARDSEAEAEKTGDTGGVYVVPAFTGLGTPYWDMYARGLIIGITRGTRKEHLVRAALESIAYQSMDVLEAMKADSGMDVTELKVDGGASANNFLMQFQADIINMNVIRPKIIETTALGAAFLAGLGTGTWESKKDIQGKWVPDKVFIPSMDDDTRKRKYSGWKKAVERSMNWDNS
ncbi:MAG: glycerol kinase GlpK [Clostridiaceae bacterium]|nr:glycerol kinase GlpK [Clostridiaceae bacterium]